VCQGNERLFALYCALTVLLFDTVFINNRNRAKAIEACSAQVGVGLSISLWSSYISSVVCFLLGNSPVSEFYMLTFPNTLHVPSWYKIHTGELPKRKHTTFRTWQKFEIKNTFLLPVRMCSFINLGIHKVIRKEINVLNLNESGLDHRCSWTV